MKNETKSVFAVIFLLLIGLGACNSVNNGPGSGCDDTTSVVKQFCGVPPDMMIQLIKNYKEQVWNKTSDTVAQKHDARFMEISIEQLENFLAYAKQNAQRDGLHVASIRMYYINYPGDKKTDEYLISHHTGNVFEDYSGCHSIALVPVVGANIHDSSRRDYYRVGRTPEARINRADFDPTSNMIFVPNNCGTASPMENHNELCPPMKGCASSTLLEIADSY